MQIRALMVGWMLFITNSVFAEEKCPCKSPSTWNVDTSLSVVTGLKTSIVRAVKSYGIPISLGLYQKKDQSTFFPLSQNIRFSYFRARNVDELADYFFLSYGLNYDRLWNVTLYAGYEVLLTIFKHEIANNELAITYHDFYLAPYIGVRKTFYQSPIVNFYGFGAVHMPTHELKQTFVEFGIGGTLPL